MRQSAVPQAICQAALGFERLFNMENEVYTVYESNFWQGHNSSDTRCNRVIYEDWYHLSFSVANAPLDYPPQPVATPNCYRICRGICMALISNLNNPLYFKDLSNSVFFWTQINSESSANPHQEIAKAIFSQYGYFMTGANIISKANPSINEVNTILKNFKGILCERNLFHYVLHGKDKISSQYILINSSDKKFFEFYPIENILSSFEPCSLHIIDCNYAGLLIPTYSAFIQDRYDQNLESDLVAFFACSHSELIPKITGLPSDLFSSCLVSPAKTAILWHSKHYYSLNCQPLAPLDISTIDSFPRGVLDEIALILLRLVEAMAIELFDEKLFIRMFRSDPSLAKITTSFFLASKIFLNYGVHPKSLPEMPDLNSHSLWDTFDLRLDAALRQFMIGSIETSLSYQYFVSQSMATILKLIEFSPDIDSLYPQATFFADALSITRLQPEALKALGCFIDKSTEAIRVLWKFPILDNVFQILPQHHDNMYMLLIVAKALCFMPTSSCYLFEIFTDPFSDFLYLLLNGDEPLFPLIISSILVKYHSEFVGAVLKTDWKQTILPLLKNPNNDVRIWCIFFISSFINNISEESEKQDFVNTIFSMMDDTSPEVRVVCLDSMINLLGKGFEDQSFEILCKQISDPCIHVRELFLLYMSNFLCLFQSDGKSKKIYEMVNLLKNDPQPVIRSFAEKFSPTSRKSSVFAWYCNAVLSPIMKSTQDSSQSIISVQPIKRPYVNISASVFEPVIFSKLQLGPYNTLKSQITSNIANCQTGQFLMGSSQGEIISSTWNDQSSIKYHNVSHKPINHIQWIRNNGYPLTIASDEAGSVYFLGNEFSVTSSMFTEKAHNVFEYSENDCILYSYSNLGHLSIYPFDVITEKPITPITFSQNTIKSVRTLSRYHNIIAVCSNKLDLIDSRTGKVSLSYSKDPNIFDFAEVYNLQYQFVTAHRNGIVTIIDIRVNEPLKVINSNSDNILSLVSHPMYPAAAVGTDKGLVLFDTEKWKMQTISSFSQHFFSSYTFQPVYSFAFNTQKFQIVSSQGPNSIIILE